MNYYFLKLMLFLTLLIFFKINVRSQAILQAKIENKFYKNPFSIKPLILIFQKDNFTWFNNKNNYSIWNAKSELHKSVSIKNKKGLLTTKLVYEFSLASSKNKKDTFFLVKSNIENKVYSIDAQKIQKFWFQKFFQGDKSDIETIIIANNGRKSYKLPINIFIGLNEEYKNIRHKYVFGTSFFYEGYINLNNFKVKFFIENEKENNFKISNKSAIKIDFDLLNKNQVYHFNDTIIINENYVLFKEISKDMTYVNYEIGVVKQKILGFNVGYQYKEFNFFDLKLMKYVSTNNIIKNKKYTLLDFWGTWCGPCIAGIPDLKDFYLEHKKEVEIISIAAENENDTIKLTNAITNYGLDWYNSLQLKNSTNEKGSILYNYKVTSFPTYILIDNSGRIVQRQEGYLDIKKISKYLDIAK